MRRELCVGAERRYRHEHNRFLGDSGFFCVSVPKNEQLSGWVAAFLLRATTFYKKIGKFA